MRLFQRRHAEGVGYIYSSGPDLIGLALSLGMKYERNCIFRGTSQQISEFSQGVAAWRRLNERNGPDVSNADIDNRFDYHQPDAIRAGAHQNVRAAVKAAAEVLDETVPAGREKSLALLKLEEAMFWANAGIARAA